DVVSEIALGRGDFVTAYHYAMRALDAIPNGAASEEWAMTRAIVRHNLGYALLGQGCYERAIVPLREGAAAFEACGARAHAVQAYINLAFAQFAVGDVDESERHLHAVEERILEPTAWLRKYVYYLRGEIAQRRGRHAEVRAE